MYYIHSVNNDIIFSEFNSEFRIWKLPESESEKRVSYREMQSTKVYIKIGRNVSTGFNFALDHSTYIK